MSRPTMSRKQFEIIAKALFQAKPQARSFSVSRGGFAFAQEQWYHSILLMSQALANTNDHFDAEKFQLACETGDMGAHRSRGMPRKIMDISNDAKGGPVAQWPN